MANYQQLSRCHFLVRAALWSQHPYHPGGNGGLADPVIRLAACGEWAPRLNHLEPRMRVQALVGMVRTEHVRAGTTVLEVGRDDQHRVAGLGLAIVPGVVARRERCPLMPV